MDAWELIESLQGDNRKVMVAVGGTLHELVDVAVEYDPETEMTVTSLIAGP